MLQNRAWLGEYGQIHRFQHNSNGVPLLGASAPMGLDLQNLNWHGEKPGQKVTVCPKGSKVYAETESTHSSTDKYGTVVTNVVTDCNGDRTTHIQTSPDSL